jgi:DNA-binding NarL/FixJ family response regulator
MYEPDLARARVLVVDDQTLSRRALRRVVEASQALVVVGEAASGEAAVTAVEELEPDLVVMDVRMPGLDGIGATRAIKQVSPDPVVFLVSMTQPDELAQEVDDSHADAIVWKGALSAELLEEKWAQHARSADLHAHGPRPRRRGRHVR